MAMADTDRQVIVYALEQHPSLGVLPRAMVCPADANGELGISSTPITLSNVERYRAIATPEDRVLLDLCMRLEPDSLFQKVRSKEVANLDEFITRYFKHYPAEKLAQEKKTYLLQVVNTAVGRVYDAVVHAPLYLPSGQLASLWPRVYMQESNPDAFYQFEYTPEGAIRYSLLAFNGSSQLHLMGGVLLSSKPARVLLGNSIYQFEEGIDGNKLKPFFSKEYIDVPPSKVDEYLQKIVKPLVPTGRIVPRGFALHQVQQEPCPVLHVGSQVQGVQQSLFDTAMVPQVQAAHYQTFRLGFEYGNTFSFMADEAQSNVKIDHAQGWLQITWVERNAKEEKRYTKAIQDMGMNLAGHSMQLKKQDGIEWLNTHFAQLEQLGIEIRQATAPGLDSPEYFIGARSLDLKLHEKQDWFDLEGKVLFGAFEIPLRQIIELIRKHRKEFRLPNGQWAQIPQEWIDEFATLFHFLDLEGDHIKLPRHHLPLVHQLEQQGLVGLDMSGRLQRLLQADSIANYELPLHFKGSLRAYQQAGYNWLRFLDEQAMGGCLADDMGLGKTVQTLALLQWMQEQGRGTSLIVAPTSLLYNWRIEAERFCPTLRLLVHSGPQRTTRVEPLAKADLVITSYAILRRDTALFANMCFNYVILDEAQNINNPATSTTQACLALNAARYLSLTGTPVENSVSDLWSQMHFVNRDILGTHAWFKRVFVDQPDPAKTARLQMMVRPFILRRLKSAVVQDLPDKVVHTHYCDMTAEQYEQYRIMRNECRGMVVASANGEPIKGSGGNHFHLLTGLLRLRQIANHPVLCDASYTAGSGKFDMVCEQLMAIVREGNKVLVFSSFTEQLKLYKQYLDQHGILYCSIDGSTKDREQQVQRFQNDEQYPVFFLSLKAGGTGLNLTRAGYVFLLDPWWNPAAEAQAFDRAHRIGQKNTVFVYKFVTRDTVEERILQLQSHKLQLAESLITAEEGFVKSLNREELQQLLS